MWSGVIAVWNLIVYRPKRNSASTACILVLFRWHSLYSYNQWEWHTIHDISIAVQLDLRPWIHSVPDMVMMKDGFRQCATYKEVGTFVLTLSIGWRPFRISEEYLEASEDYRLMNPNFFHEFQHFAPNVVRHVNFGYMFRLSQTCFAHWVGTLPLLCLPWWSCALFCEVWSWSDLRLWRWTLAIEMRGGTA